MIGELVVRSRQPQFRHMARSAVAIRHFATDRSSFTAGMAGLALRIVRGIVPIDFLVRIVACRALDAGIIGIVAFAARKPVGLKADVGDAQHPRSGNLIPGPMALAAKVRRILRTHLTEVFHLRQGGIALLDSLQVIFRFSMAAFALHAGS